MTVPASGSGVTNVEPTLRFLRTTGTMTTGAGATGTMSLTATGRRADARVATNLKTKV